VLPGELGEAGRLDAEPLVCADVYVRLDASRAFAEQLVKQVEGIGRQSGGGELAALLAQ
jgi:hypothetical protein